MNKLNAFVKKHQVPVTIATTTAVVGTAAIVSIVVLKKDYTQTLGHVFDKLDVMETIARGAGVTDETIVLAMNAAGL